MANNHEIADCPQGPTIDKMARVLDRVVVALETIAEHGARVTGLEKQVEKNDHDLREVFGRVRIIENGKAEATEVKAVDLRIRNIELAHAVENGAEEVIEKSSKFWDGVKIQLADKLILFIIFVLVVADKFNVFVWLHKLWKELLG